jgi:UDPglucose--hexose-1-phosphate uridylyltransferase
MNPQIRLDPLTGKYTLLSSARGKRPVALKNSLISHNYENVQDCPFCRGREYLTPPAKLVVDAIDGEIKVLEDVNAERSRNWFVRIFPNAYPAVIDTVDYRLIDEFTFTGSGYHEVVVETPDHTKQPSDMKPEEYALALWGSFHRIRRLLNTDRIKYVMLVRNYGPLSGASQPHPHMQLIATPFIPPLIEREVRNLRRFQLEHKTCYLCMEVRRSMDSGRLVYSNESFVSLMKYAPTLPYEVIILPKDHGPTPLNRGWKYIVQLSDALVSTLRAIKRCLNNPSYNMWFHISPNDESDYHWHIEIAPIMSMWGGLEKGGDVYIVGKYPEEAAEELRKCINFQ